MFSGMATENTNVEEQADGSSRKSRGPGVPTITLDKALDLMRKVWEQEKRNPAPVKSILSHWGYASKSSGGLLAIASMKRFGLLDEQGSKEKRTLQLSPLALELLKHESANPGEFERILKQVALKPEMHAYLWNQYRLELPSDQTLQSHFVFDKNFSEETAKAFLADYKDTIKFAKLSAGDTIQETANKNGNEQTNSIFKAAAGFFPPPQAPVAPVVHPPKTPMTPMIPSVQPGELPVPIADGMVARVPFPMTEEDFELLIGTLQLWKKKLVRAVTPGRKFPAQAIWKNNDFDKPVTIVGEMGEKDGQKFFQSQDGTGIPASELWFNS
jgi:hypothetical protein